MGGGQLGSTIAGQAQANIAGERSKSIGDYVAEQEATAYDKALQNAGLAQAAGYALSGQGVANVGNYGTSLVNRANQYDKDALNIREKGADIGIRGIYGNEQEYLKTVLNPTTSSPDVTVPQPSGTDPLTFGAGQALQTYSDILAAQKKYGSK